jgi:hypothetical protein
MKTSLNPALRPQRGYVGIPGLTNLSLGYQTNAFTLEHFLFPGKGQDGKTAWFLNENVSYDQFMKGISDKNYLNLDINETALGFGFYLDEAFLSFDVSLRANTEINIPKDVFDFLKKGIILDGTDNRDYNFSDVSADAIAYGQIGFGGSYPFLDNSLVVGTKIKVLLGLANGRFNLDKMKLNIGQDLWTLSETQATLQYTVKGLEPTYNEDGVFSGFDTDNISSLSVNGFGLGLDLGATFKPGYFIEDKSSFLNNFTVSMAVTDMGYIKWNESNHRYLATNPGDPVVLTGDKEIRFENTEDLSSELKDAFKDAYNFQEKTDGVKRRSSLKAKLNWGIEYAFPEKNLNVGLLSTTYFNTSKAISEYTIGGAIKPVNGVEASLSYSFAYGHFQTIGLSLHLGSFFYIASDYLFPKTNSVFAPVSAKAFNLQLGFVVPIGEKR